MKPVSISTLLNTDITTSITTYDFVKTSYSIVLPLLCALSINTYATSETNSAYKLSLEELMNIEVVSLNRVEESLFLAPAAIYIISRQEIERSGAEQITDLLQRVPGLSVRQLSRHRTSMALRNDNEFWTSNNLVLIDGERFFHPSINMYVWETFDVALEDIERIEIIRGSGGVTWGTNSVNGVINIITRDSSDLSLLNTKLGAGTHNRKEGVAQLSHSFDDASVRLTVLADDDDGFDHDNAAPDPRDRALITLRADADINDWDMIFNYRNFKDTRHETNVFTGEPKDSEDNTQNLSLAGKRALPNDAVLELRGSTARNNYEVGNLGVDTVYNTQDAEILYTQPWKMGTTFMSYNGRHYHIQPKGSVYNFDEDKSIRLKWQALVLNHSFDVTSKLNASLGLRQEHYNLIENKDATSATARLAYHWRENVFLWASSSQSKQYPSSSQVHNYTIFSQVTSPVAIDYIQTGSSTLTVETATDYHLGLRWLLNNDSWLDGNIYYMTHDDQVSVDNSLLTKDFSTSPFRFIVPNNNYIDSKTRGMELMWSYNSTSDWKSELNFTYLDRESTSNSVNSSNQPSVSFPEYKIIWALSSGQFLNGTLHSTLSWEKATITQNPLGPTAAADSFIEVKDMTRLDVSYHYWLTPKVKTYLSAKNLFNNRINWDYELGVSPAQKVEPSATVGFVYRH